MSKKFNFRSHSLDLEINGVKFSVDMSDTKDAGKITEVGEELKALGENENVTNEMVIDKFKQAINLFLSDDKAVEKIFKDREVTLFDAYDVLQFLKDESFAYRQREIANRYNITDEQPTH